MELRRRDREAVGKCDRMRGLDARRSENTGWRDPIESSCGTQTSDHQVGFVDTVAAFNQVSDLADIEPTHPRTIDFECCLHLSRRRFVTVEPCQHRPGVQA